MFGTIIALAIFFAAALVGWILAELKGKMCNYVKNDDEEAVDQQLAEQLHKNGFVELSIKDVIESISTKGFSTT